MADFSEWSPEASGTTSPPPVPPPDGLPSFADRTHTVSASATGGGTGTDGSPWTLAEACQFCQPGMIIGLRAGVYIGTDPLPGSPPDDGHPDGTSPRRFYGGFNILNSGTAQERISFVAEHLASLETDTARMSWVRSGATLVGRGWAGVSIRGNYVSLIGVYYSDVGVDNSHACNDSGRILVWANVTDTHIKYCRIYKDRKHGDYQQSITRLNNDAAIRLEGSEHAYISDCHFEASWTGYRVNTPHIQVYSASYSEINNCQFYNGENAVWCKRGFASNSFNGKPAIIRFHNNYTKSVSRPIFLGGIRDEAADTNNEDDRNWIYCNVFDTPVEKVIALATDNITSLVHNGIRIFNNVVGGAPSLGNGSIDLEVMDRMTLYTNQWSPPDRNNMTFNNIFLPTQAYYLSGVPNDSEPRDLVWINALWKTQRNIVQSYTQLFRGREPLSSATWADLQASGGETNSLQGVSPNLDADFRPQTGSPAIGLGRDLLGAFGPVNGVIDAGCYPTGDEVIGIRNG